MGSQRVFVGARLAHNERRCACRRPRESACAVDRVRPLRVGVDRVRDCTLCRRIGCLPDRARCCRSACCTGELALIGAIYPRDERNSAVAIWAGASALTTAAGPALGGLLTDRFGWQSIFWINPPIAVAAVGLLANSAPTDRREQRRFDVIGAGILAAVLCMLAWALGRIGPGGSAPERIAAPLKDSPDEIGHSIAEFVRRIRPQ